MGSELSLPYIQINTTILVKKYVWYTKLFALNAV